jgi:hypothetical protein
MSKRNRDDGQLFLLGQNLSQLMVKNPTKLLELLCEDPPTTRAEGEATQEKWKRRSRAMIVAKAASKNAPRRVALVCSAGRGKTTNMRWLQAHIAAECGGEQVPFLFRLEWDNDIKTLEAAIKDFDSLLDWMASRVQRAASGDLKRHRWALERYLREGRITLLFDGLDHVMGREAFTRDLALLLNSPRWRACPVWVSGRREAFKKWAKVLFADGPFRVLQVVPLEKPEIGFFIQWHTGRDWYHDFPPASRELLATPRILGLICEVLRKQIPRPPRNKKERHEKILALELDTAAGVYHHAYFHVGLPSEPDSQGFLAQGLRAENERIGSREPTDLNFPSRIKRMGLVLGAIAFYMFGRNSLDDNPVPNLSGIDPEILIEEIGPKLEHMGHGTPSQQFPACRKMAENCLNRCLPS